MDKTTLRLPADQWRAVRQQALNEDRTAQALVIEAIAEYLKRRGGKL